MFTFLIFAESHSANNVIWSNKSVEANISSPCISSDFRYVAGIFSGQPSKLKVLDLTTKQIIFQQDGDYAYPIVFSSDSKKLAVYRYNIKQLDIWNVTDNKSLFSQALNVSDMSINVMKFSPDGSKLYFAEIQSELFRMFVVDMSSMKFDSFSIPAIPNKYFSFEFAISPDNKNFLIATQAKVDQNIQATLYICNFQDTSKVYLNYFNNELRNFEYTRDGKYIVATTGNMDPTAISESEVCLIDTKDNSKAFTSRNTENKPNKIYQSVDGSKYYIFYEDYYFKLLDLTTKQITKKINYLGQYPFYAPYQNNKILGIKYDKIYSFDFDNPDATLLYSDYKGDMCTNQINDVKISPNNKYFATGGDDGIIKLWNIDNGKLISTLYGLVNPVHAMDFSADSKYLASVSGEPFTKLNVWDLATNNSTFSKIFDFGNLTVVSFSPDGNYLVVGNSKDSITVFKTSDWKTLKTFQFGQYINNIKFSPDSKYLIISHRYLNTIKILNTSDWSLLNSGDILTIDSSKGITDISVSKNNDVVAVACADNNVRIYNIGTWNYVNTLKGKTKFSDGTETQPQDDIKMSFINGSKYILGTFGNFAKIWDVKNNNDRYIYEDIISSQTNDYLLIASMSVHNKAEFFVSGSYDGSITKWFMPDLGTGVNDGGISASALAVYPNPATNSIKVLMPFNLTGNLNCRIYNSRSELVESFSADDGDIQNLYLTHDVSLLSPGMYILQINNGTKCEIQKFIKY